jgi:hypothetical protein
MLKKILSVSGKPGLFKLISQGKNMFIAESLLDHKRIPVYLRDKVVSLGDISIYTDDEDVSLSVVLKNVLAKEDGKAIDFNPSTITPTELKDYLATVLPNFDQERVYPSDIRKLMSWYNLLVKEGLTDFSEEEEETEEVKETPESSETSNS